MASNVLLFVSGPKAKQKTKARMQMIAKIQKLPAGPAARINDKNVPATSQFDPQTESVASDIACPRIFVG